MTSITRTTTTSIDFAAPSFAASRLAYGQGSFGGSAMGGLGDLLAGRNRTKAAPTFMPDGLYLAQIEYDSKWGLPQETPRILPAF